MGLFEDQYYQRCILVTDDNHADTLKNLGHIDKIIRMAINLGAAPIKAIKMASYNPALHYKLHNYGAIANGYIANFIILNDLNKFEIDSVYFNGNIVSIGNKVLAESDVKFNSLDKNKFKRFYDSFNMSDITVSDLDFKNKERN